MENQYSDNDKRIVNRINLYIKNVDKTDIKNMKILTIINLMNYLSRNIDFINKHEKFKLCVLQKCELLKEELPENIPPLLLEQFNRSTNEVSNLLK